MAEVDPQDDTIERYVVRHFRYDPERSERRHVALAAYDNEQEFEARIEQENRKLASRRASGQAFDAREHVTGTYYEPGHSRLAANGRLVKRAFRRGVGGGRWLDELELPRNMGVVMHSPDPSVEGQPSAEDR